MTRLPRAGDSVTNSSAATSESVQAWTVTMSGSCARFFHTYSYISAAAIMPLPDADIPQHTHSSDHCCAIPGQSAVWSRQVTSTLLYSCLSHSRVRHVFLRGADFWPSKSHAESSATLTRPCRSLFTWPIRRPKRGLHRVRRLPDHVRSTPLDSAEVFPK